MGLPKIVQRVFPLKGIKLPECDPRKRLREGRVRWITLRTCIFEDSRLFVPKEYLPSKEKKWISLQLAVGIGSERFPWRVSNFFFQERCGFDSSSKFQLHPILESERNCLELFLLKRPNWRDQRRHEPKDEEKVNSTFWKNVQRRIFGRRHIQKKMNIRKLGSCRSFSFERKNEERRMRRREGGRESLSLGGEVERTKVERLNRDSILHCWQILSGHQFGKNRIYLLLGTGEKWLRRKIARSVSEAVVSLPPWIPLRDELLTWDSISISLIDWTRFLKGSK